MVVSPESWSREISPPSGISLLLYGLAEGWTGQKEGLLAV